MLKPRNPEGRTQRQPIGGDVFRTKPRAPAPRLRDKDAHNPPIVTVFGAGIAGLTAAHELAERGFLVQVVESARDPYERRALVGGMAATQSARVRANIEDLHPQFVTTRRAEGEQPEDPEAEAVAQWLLRLFLNNRSFWIQTEEPRPVHSVLYSFPSEPVGPSGERPEEPISGRVQYLLEQAREAYRDRWIWDLVVRLPLIYEPNELLEPDPNLLVQYEALKKVANEQGTAALARKIAELKLAGAELDPAILARHEPDIVRALEREFLCFRLRPFAAEGVDGGTAVARELFIGWGDHFKTTSLLEHCLWPFSGSANHEPVPSVRLPKTLEGDLGLGGGLVKGWIEIEIMEQRLPGEHGFRFFPAYYRHVDDTMKRIPLFEQGAPTSRTVYHNLRPTTIQGIGLSRQDLIDKAKVPVADDEMSRLIRVHRERAHSIEEFRDRTDRFMQRFGATPKDGALFFAKLVRFMTSCAARREQKYEQQSWAEFIGLNAPGNSVEGLLTKYSDAMADQIRASAQVLLAFTAAQADARTYGDTAIQLLMDSLGDGTNTDRTLTGPTSDAWLEPWREYLELQGVRFFRGELECLELSGEELVPKLKEAATPVSQDGYRLLTHASPDAGRRPDFYVLALDFKRAAELIKPFAVDPQSDFGRCVTFYAQAGDALKDMTGVQYFFDAKLRLGEGHLYYPYSEWGLSSISQSEFWAKRNGFADGFFGVLSVDVANTKEKNARGFSFADVLRGDDYKTGDADLRRWRAAAEVWHQLEPRITTVAMPDASNVRAAHGLSYPRCFHVDRSVQAGNFSESDYITSKYLAAFPGQWGLRPGQVASDNIEKPGRDAYGRPFERENREIKYGLHYDRWVLSGSYMATRTRITTMESANESGRHAVIAILDALERASGDEVKKEPSRLPQKYNGAMRRRRYDRPQIWNPEAHELPDMMPLRRLDERLVASGLPHFLDIIDFDRRFALALYSAEIREQDARIALDRKRHDKPAANPAKPDGPAKTRGNYTELVLQTLQSAVSETLGPDQYDIRGVVDDFLAIFKTP